MGTGDLPQENSTGAYPLERRKIPPLQNRKKHIPMGLVVELLNVNCISNTSLSNVFQELSISQEKKLHPRSIREFPVVSRSRGHTKQALTIFKYISFASICSSTQPRHTQSWLPYNRLDRCERLQRSQCSQRSQRSGSLG